MTSTTDELVHFAPEREFRDAVARLFRHVEAWLGSLVPGADIQHVGSTEIPNSLTKGDLDVQVRVARADYDAAREKLAQLYRVNAGGFAADDAISFADDGTHPPLGIHLSMERYRAAKSQFMLRVLEGNDRAKVLT